MPSHEKSWAWPLFKDSKDYYNKHYHGNRNDYVFDPRRHAQDSEIVGRPESSANEEPYFDLTVPETAPGFSAEIAEYDLGTDNIVSTAPYRRAPSDDYPLRPEREEDVSQENRYRSLGIKSWQRFKGYKPAPGRGLHYTKLNLCQYIFYPSAAAKRENRDGLRVGETYTDYHTRALLKKRGDSTARDGQGLQWKFNLRVLENSRNESEPTWSKADTEMVQHTLNCLLESMNIESKYFRHDLFRFNSLNRDNMQSYGHVGLCGTGQGEGGRPERVSDVLLRLSRFGNLAPVSSDRQILRTILNLSDEISRDTPLLSPLDACEMMSSLVIIPKWVRTATIIRFFSFGYCIGLIIVLTRESKTNLASHSLPLAASLIPTRESPDNGYQQSKLLATTKERFKKTATRALLYKQTQIGLPCLYPEAPSQLPSEDSAFDPESHRLGEHAARVAQNPDILNEAILEEPSPDSSETVDPLNAAILEPPEAGSSGSASNPEEAANAPNSPTSEASIDPGAYGPDAWLAESASKDFVDFFILNEISRPYIVLSDFSELTDESSETSSSDNAPFGPQNTPLNVVYGPPNDPRLVEHAEELYYNPQILQEMFENITPERNSYLHTLTSLYVKRIIKFGTRDELYTLSLQRGTPMGVGKLYEYFRIRDATCLQGLSEAEIQAVIGPHSEEKYAEFERRFRPAERDWVGISQRVNENFVQQETTNDSSVQDSNFARSIHHEAFLRSQQPSYLAKPLPAVPRPSDDPRADVFPDATPRQSVTARSEASNESDGPVPDVIDPTASVLCRELAERENLWAGFFDHYSPAGDPAAEPPAEKYSDVNEDLLRNPHFVNDYTETTPVKFLIPRDCPLPEDVVSQVSDEEMMHLAEDDALPVNQIGENQPLNDQRLNDFSLPVATPKRVRRTYGILVDARVTSMARHEYSFAIPSFITPWYRHSYADLDYTGNGPYIHPFSGQTLEPPFDFTLSGFFHMVRREQQIFNRDGPFNFLQRPVPFHPTNLHLALGAKVHNATSQIVFPHDSVYTMVSNFCFPRKLPGGIHHRLSILPADSDSVDYPGILPELRNRIPLNLYSETGIQDHRLGQLDRRFYHHTDPAQNIHRVMASVEKMPFMEPTFFPEGSRRDWRVILADVDTHSFGELESFIMLVAKITLLQRTLPLYPDRLLPETFKGVRFYASSRLGYPHFCLSASVGGNRLTPPSDRDASSGSRAPPPAPKPSKWQRISPELSGPWALKVGGRFLEGLFRGAVQRITVEEYEAKGMSERDYNYAVEDRTSGVEQFIENFVGPNDTTLRRRRTDRFPRSMVGTVRKVYDSKGTFICAERVLWEGFHFASKVFNLDKNDPTAYAVNLEGKSEFVGHGGPRLLLSHCDPIEEDLVSAIQGLAQFALEQAGAMNARGKKKYPWLMNPKLDGTPSRRLPAVRFHPEMGPPSWKLNFDKIRAFFGESAYADFEEFYHLCERDIEMYPMHAQDPRSVAYFNSLTPYSPPQQHDRNETTVRVNCAGAVYYNHEEILEESAMMTSFAKLPDSEYPPVALNYSAQMAKQTAAQRPYEANQPSKIHKRHSTAEFGSSSKYL